MAHVNTFGQPTSGARRGTCASHVYDPRSKLRELLFLTKNIFFRLKDDSAIL